jgi:hypothetical protein
MTPEIARELCDKCDPMEYIYGIIRTRASMGKRDTNWTEMSLYVGDRLRSDGFVVLVRADGKARVQW